MLDNASLLIGIAFSSASLLVALLIGWMNARQQSYLAYGAAGMGLVVFALLIMGLRDGRYDLISQFVPFSALLAGFALVFAGVRRFRDAQSSLLPPLLFGGTAITLTAMPLIAGYSGIGTLMLNACSAVLMFFSGREYWRGRQDAPIPMVANAMLYTLVALSFLACAIVLAADGQWVLDRPPANWAEDANSILSLVGLTGIGAITLTLHHARAARRHREEANTDSLTGVLNRRALFSRFRETDIVAGLAVLMFDLDHFKQINDRLGHAKGDQVLSDFAIVLRTELRANDIIARIGGEEFCVILPGLNRDAARQAAERVRLAFAALRIGIGDSGEIATVSAGLATGGVDETFSSVLRRADDALYKAKSSGRNQVHLAALRLVA
ncbi:GGDEF domain-containing protein [Devosia sp. YIM 151766]|uniref:GGDEF domain-containing protein n=1 Tax=Devosia sp. YIM 151766 TaxID=3017325 RepID=UPI00255C6A6E|nr:GGDEF domain-containing protein [Devosia sp. YIM 151766]WIY51802.1 GGDEF domain-containing protein [Devosia sp. YIM 151766]